MRAHAEECADTARAQAAGRVLLVGGDAGLARDVRRVLDGAWPQADLVHALDAEHARALIERTAPNAICVRIQPPYGRAVSALRRLRALARSTPIVALGAQRDVSFVDLVLRSGASLWLVDQPLEDDELEDALRPTLTPAPRAEARATPASRAQLLALEPLGAPCEGLAPRDVRVEHPVERGDADAPTPAIEAPSSSETAPSPRDEPAANVADEPSHASEAQVVSAPPLELVLARARRLVVVPIGPRGLPAASSVLRVRHLDVADRTLRASFDAWTPLAGGHALAIGELDDARNEFAWVEHDLRASAAEGVCVLRVRGTLEDLLDPARLEPVLDPATMRYRYGHAEEFVAAWCELGVLEPVVVDRVLVCPRCDALPTIRLGCRRCGSARVACEKLLHHFACANVARASEYETAHGLQCPKCRARELVVNADYEYLSGPWDCRDCGYECGERDPVCHCLVCAERFFSRDANELELVSYHAARMEPLALLAAP